jgi:hypothetical protein
MSTEKKGLSVSVVVEISEFESLRNPRNINQEMREQDWEIAENARNKKFKLWFFHNFGSFLQFLKIGLWYNLFSRVLNN